jgi:hypothetical protein
MSHNRQHRALAIETFERREMMSAAPWSGADVCDERVPAAVASADPAPSSTTSNRALSENQNLTAIPAPPIDVSISKGVLIIRALQADHQVIVKPVNGQLLIRTTLWHGHGMYQDLYVPQSAVSKIEYRGTSGRDVFVNDTDLESTAHGYGEWDIFEGGSARDVFFGGAGADNLKGGGGNDELYGDAGNDYLYGESGRDVLRGGADNDHLYGGEEKDVLLGDTGVDGFDGQGGIDTIYAEPTDFFKNFDRSDVIIRPTFLSLEPQGSMNKSEGARGAITTYLFRVTRTGDINGTTSVAYAVRGAGSSPASAADFVGGRLPAGVITFAKNETVKFIEIKVAGDATVEANEGFTVTLSNAVLPATIVNASVSARINNDDLAPRVLAENSLSPADAIRESYEAAFNLIEGSATFVAPGKNAAASVGIDRRSNDASGGMRIDRPAAIPALDAVFTLIGSNVPNGVNSALSTRLLGRI